VEGGGARDLGDGKVLDVTTTCFTGGLDGGEDITLVCNDSTYHLGLGRVGGGVFTSFCGDLGFPGTVGSIIAPTGLGILDTVATDVDETVTVSGLESVDTWSSCSVTMLLFGEI